MSSSCNVVRLNNFGNVLKKSTHFVQKRGMYSNRFPDREVVGTWNGIVTYCDSLILPIPPVRFQRINPELRKKEKGDWKEISIADKKAIYRISYCQTLAEVKAPTGDWKVCIGAGLWATSLAFLLLIYMEKYGYDQLPDSFKEKNQKAQIQRMVDLYVNPFTGISSKWNYEKNRWK